mgnify:CR=1 FL=1
MAIRVEFEGTFSDRSEAAEALEDAAYRVRRGEYSAQQPASANPMVFVTEGDDDD